MRTLRVGIIAVALLLAILSPPRAKAAVWAEVSYDNVNARYPTGDYNKATVDTFFQIRPGTNSLGRALPYKAKASLWVEYDWWEKRANNTWYHFYSGKLVNPPLEWINRSTYMNFSRTEVIDLKAIVSKDVPVAATDVRRRLHLSIEVWCDAGPPQDYQRKDHYTPYHFIVGW